VHRCACGITDVPLRRGKGSERESGPVAHCGACGQWSGSNNGMWLPAGSARSATSRPIPDFSRVEAGPVPRAPHAVGGPTRQLAGLSDPFFFARNVIGSQARIRLSRQPAAEARAGCGALAMGVQRSPFRHLEVPLARSSDEPLPIAGCGRRSRGTTPSLAGARVKRAATP
jgi:hypothetical protein